MNYLGDFVAGAVIDFPWSTNGGDGASIDRATNGTIRVYKGNSTTDSVAGVTDTETFDGLTGLHHCRITTASDAAFYAAANDFFVVLAGAVIDGKTVNVDLAQFSIQNRYPTVANIQSGLATAAALTTLSGLVDDLEGRLTAARAGYLDNLSAGAVATAAALATVNTYVDELESRLTAARAGYLDSLNSGVSLSAAAVDAVLDDVMEGSLTVRQALRIMLAALAGKSAGGGTGTITYRDIADTKNRISATVDANRNRTAVTRDGS